MGTSTPDAPFAARRRKYLWSAIVAELTFDGLVPPKHNGYNGQQILALSATKEFTLMAIDRVVVFRPDDPVAFLAEACAAAANAANQLRVARATDGALVDVYAELVVAYARVERDSYTGARLAIIDHLIERIAQARRGEIVTSLVDIVDRLHGELTATTTSV